LSPSPRTYDQLGTWVTDYLRQLGMSGISYLDDWLFQNVDPFQLIQQSLLILREFCSLGFYVNLPKSELLPTQHIQYLGVIFDTVNNLIVLPADKITALRVHISLLLSTMMWSRKQCQKFCGKLAFNGQVVPLGRLHTRLFQMHLNTLPRDEELDHVQRPIPPSLIPDFEWWSLHVSDPDRLFASPPTDFLVADASNSGCGAVINGQPYATTWRDYQLPWHINDKELFAVTHFAKQHLSALSGGVLQVQTDNSTTLAYLANQGGTKSPTLYYRTRKFLLHLHRFNIRLSIVRIPST